MTRSLVLVAATARLNDEAFEQVRKLGKLSRGDSHFSTENSTYFNRPIVAARTRISAPARHAKPAHTKRLRIGFVSGGLRAAAIAILKF